VAFVFRIFDSVKQLGVTPRPSAILRRTAAANLDEARIEHTRFGIGETLDLDRVFPSVAEVIEIDELPGADIFENVVELRLARIQEVANPIRIGIGSPARIS
jgi:hypothetical protein